MSDTMWLRDKTVKHARKQRVCSICPAVAVRPGDSYTSTLYLVDDTVGEWLLCADCRAITDEVMDWCCNELGMSPYEGIGPDDYIEWARAHPDHEGARALTARFEASS